MVAGEGISSGAEAHPPLHHDGHVEDENVPSASNGGADAPDEPVAEELLLPVPQKAVSAVPPVAPKPGPHRRASSSASHTHSQSRSTMARLLPATIRHGSAALAFVPTHAARDNALRMKRLDAFSHAELLVLQALVASVAHGNDRGDRELLLLKRHPFLARQRDVLCSVLSHTDASAKRLLASRPADPSKRTHEADEDYSIVRDSKLKKALQMDYPAWRKKFFQKTIDQRLRLKRRGFEKLFPAVKELPHGVTKRIFTVFDANGSRKVEFRELCESLARCTHKHIVVSSHGSAAAVSEDDERIVMVFQWFMEKHEVKVTRQGLVQLEATLRAIERYYKLPKTTVDLVHTGGVNCGGRVDVTTKLLCDQLLAGQVSVGPDDFYDRLMRLPGIVDVLMRPFDILTPIVAQHEILQMHETTKWRVGDAAYVLDSSWWNRWLVQAGTSSTHQSNQDEHPRDEMTTTELGPITNASLCVEDVEGVLKPGLQLGVDFVLVAGAVWRKLQHLYGGGPELPRKIIAQPDVPTPVQTADDAQDNQELVVDDGESIAIDERIRVHLYPLVLNLRLMKTDTIHTSLLMARRVMLSASTKLKDLLHRVGLAPGVNVQSVSFWMRRHRWDVWRRIECSLDAPRSSLELIGIRSGHELIVDFKAFGVGSAAAKKQLFADNHFVLSLYQPLGNDFVCLAPGIDCAMTSANWNAQPIEATDEMGNSFEQDDSEDDRGAELYTGGHSGLITNTGFFVNMNEQFKFKKKPLPRLVAPAEGGFHVGGVRATGLLNMGNTCFLNCAIQCVGHSPVLREYFLSERYLDDVNKVNSLGTKGKIASAYGRLMDALWSQLREPQNCFAPAGFRDEFARHRTQFQESSQHDAHEFIVSLLDSLHEDLNRKRGGRSVKSKSGLLCLPFYGARHGSTDVDDDDTGSASAMGLEDGSSSGSSSDEVIGSTAWQAHARVNSSVVVDLFHGQMRSETVCSSCDERKATFDPFLFFSVPIPEPKFLRVEVKILLQVRSSATNAAVLESLPPSRQGFWLPRRTKVADLCEEISQQYGLAARRFVIVEVRRNRIKRIFDEGETLETVAPFRDLYAFERAWGMDDIPVVPERIARVFGEPVDAEEAALLKDAHIRDFSDLRVGSRVDGVGFHGDWHPGSVIGVSTGSGTSAHRTSRALVHFDAFSTKWDKWFSPQDWTDGNIGPVHTKTKRSEEVFEVQVVHRRVIPFQRASYMHSMSRGSAASASHNGSMLEVFGVPMFVTIASTRSAHALHGAILLQASRFVQGFEDMLDGEEVPYDTRVVDLDDVSSLLGVPLPRDSSCVLQHFATQSVIVLDWKEGAYQESEKQLKDRIPEEMAEFEREHTRSKNSESILSNSTSLTSCLDALFKAEEISLDDHWTCERCGVKRAGTRRSDVWKLPDLVMIQLKRFQYQENGYRQKVRTMVDFPLHGLDFSQWMGKEGSGNHGSADPGCVYDLYAVANHVGGLARGHYTAYCRYDSDFEESARTFSTLGQDRHHRGSAADIRFDDVWYRFDDEKVVEIAPSDIATEAAYVLFYKRRKLSPHNVLAYAM